MTKTGIFKEFIKTNKAWAFTFCFFSLLFIVINWGVINRDNIETGDYAANSLLVQDAKHFTLLKGNYSRVGLNHPGPAILYSLAFGELVFYDWLPIAKSPFSGQLMAAAMYMAFWLVLAARIIRRYNESFISSVFFVALFMLMTRVVPFVEAQNFYTNIWFPRLYFFPFVAFIAAGSRLALGKFDSLGTMAVSAGFLINGHASFIAIVPIITFVALALNFLSKFIFEKRYLITFKNLLENKKKIFLAFGLLLIFLLPLILLTIIEYPGPLAQYYHFSKFHTATPLKEACHFVAYYWGGDTAMLWGIFSLLIALLTIRWWKSADLLWGMFSVIIASTLAVLYYAIKGVDMLGETYIGYFYFAIPALFITTIFYKLIPSVLFVKKTGLYLLSALCIFFFAKLSFDTVPDPTYNVPQVKALYDSLNKIKLKDERIIITPNNWMNFVGLANYAKRNKNSLFCILEKSPLFFNPEQSWHILYTDALKCTPEEEANNTLKYVVYSNPNQIDLANAAFNVSDLYFFPMKINPGEFLLTHKNMSTPMGHLTRRDNNEEYWLSEEDAEGWVWTGPYMSLAQGDYDVYFNVSVRPLAGPKIDRPVRLDICKDGGTAILAERTIEPPDYNKSQFVFSLSLKETAYALEFRIYKFSNTVVEVKDIFIRKR